MLKTGLDRSLRSRRSERSADEASAGDGSKSAKPAASARARLLSTTAKSAPRTSTSATSSWRARAATRRWRARAPPASARAIATTRTPRETRRGHDQARFAALRSGSRLRQVPEAEVFSVGLTIRRAITPKILALVAQRSREASGGHGGPAQRGGPRAFATRSRCQRATVSWPTPRAEPPNPTPFQADPFDAESYSPGPD